MSNSRQLTARNFGVILAAVLALAGGSATCVAATSDGAQTAALQPIEELQQLDEIRVRGKSLSDMIEDAEDNFVRHFNKLNKKNDFDVVCDYLRLDRDSLALSRTCLPQFLGYYSMGPVSFGMGVIPAAGTSICSAGNYITTDSGTYFSAGTCTPAFSSFSGYSSMSMPTMMRRPENAYTGKLRQEYVRALVRNIYRDQSLLDQAIELTDLRNEMQTIQDRYQQVKAEEDERKQAARRERREQQRQNSSQIARPRNPRL
jgi:hypothetical protein